MKKGIQKISVVIPVYNELGNIEPLNALLLAELKTTKLLFELIYVDDYSSDGTYEYLLKQSKSKNITVKRKQGKRGKAYSLIEGFHYATGDVLVMIDGDLQYPPSAIPGMVDMLRHGDIIVANRKKYHASLSRRILSRGFKNLFGALLFGLHSDVQSGLKVFKKRVFDSLQCQPSSPWTFDLEFLYKAKEAGFTIINYDIAFFPRNKGVSKVQFVHQIFEIGFNALFVKLKRIQPRAIPPDGRNMIGAGIGYKKHQYITHTTLSYKKTALQTFLRSQIIFFFLCICSLLLSMYLFPLRTVQVLITFISVVYFIDVLFNLYLIIRSLRNDPEIQIDEKDADLIPDENLPLYSILCPLYKEADILPQFLDAIKKLEWPKNKLEVLLLLEEDDTETIDEVHGMKLPAFVRPVIVPLSQPKTKPKACNYGLNIAKGEYIVIYDAEDIPDPLQLKKAYIGFQKLPENIICLQAKLNYYNPHQNWLTRFFALEYSLWFDMILPGLQSIQTSIPLGGTSNHFRAKYLKKLQGWDTFNVTEDADLGIRLFKEGYKTAIIDSVTLEEANSNIKNWIRQRSRWIKGYLQSYLVHMRDIGSFAREKGIHAFLFQLTVGSKLTFIFLNPVLWLATISYFSLYTIVGPTLELIYVAPAFYLGAISLVFGNFLFLYYYMVGTAKRKQWDLMLSALFIPIYWVMISVGGWVALYQLLFKPHYWEKTIHGLHLAKRKKKVAAIQIEIEKPKVKPIIKPVSVRPAFFTVIRSHFKPWKEDVTRSVFLVGGVSLAHVINLIYNIFIYRIPSISLEAISLISLVGSLSYLASVPFSALQSTISHKVGIIDSKYNKQTADAFWGYMRKRFVSISFALAIVWLLLSPLFMFLFHVHSLTPFVLLSLIWLVGLRFSIDRGYVSGKLLFGYLALVIFLEPVYKFALSLILISFDLIEYMYIAIPLAYVLAFLTGSVINPGYSKQVKEDVKTGALKFPRKFFLAAFLSNIANVAFMSIDILLANHFLSQEEAGKYAILSLSGKMIFFLGNLSTQFVIPLVSRLEGKKQSTERLLYFSLLGTAISAGIGFITFAFFGNIVLPFLYGEKASYITPYIFAFSFGIYCFTISKTIVSYYLAKNIYTYPVTVVLLTVLQIIFIGFKHSNLTEFVYVVAALGQFHLLCMLFLHRNNNTVQGLEKSLGSFIKGEKSLASQTEKTGKESIVFFNWRDTKHIWAGGAEVYIHEIAKRWVKQGKNVTIFCGNDRRSPRNEIIEGVRIIRRGGTYTVYLWAFFYYVFMLRKKTSVVIDCENGIPFFTPLYVRKPVFLLIHHVHQEVFRQYLFYPIAVFVAFLESKVMPLVYKNKPVITVSESSKKAITALGFAHPENIEIVYNGIEPSRYKQTKKTTYPSYIYLGRLKAHKNIDVCIKAFAQIREYHKNAMLRIVGEGECLRSLQKLVMQLHLEKHVVFYGKVSEEMKAQLLAESWVMVQPSQIEGWGITVIEANCSGTPVIASRVNGLRDSVVHGETGLLVEPGNITAFYKAMKLLVEDQKFLEKLSQRALIWAKRFTWDRSANVLDDIITAKIEADSLYFPRYGDIFLAQREEGVRI